MKTQTFFLVAVVALSVTSALDSRGEVLLEINVADPSAVVISATNGTVPVTAAISEFDPGVRLDDFFSTSSSGFFSLSGDLRSAFGFHFLNGVADSTFFYLDTNANDTYNVGAQAFQGSSSFDGSGLALPSLGSQGIIDVNGVTMGEWAVIPEPTSAALLALGGVAIAVGRRSRTAQPPTV